MTRRTFGTLDGAALVVSTVVGAGIFTIPSYVAQLAGSAVTVLALWLAGGLMALAGALCYAELAARMPRGGAEYTYLREAFGPTAGFLSGWTSFIAGFSGAIAAAAVGFARHLAGVAPALAGREVGVALLLIGAFTAISIAGVGASRVATNLLTGLIIIGAAAMTVAGLTGSATVAAPIEPSGARLGILSALVPIFFTYSGWNAAAYVAGEFRDPARTVPRALIAGTSVVTLLYVGLNAALLRSMSTAGVAASTTPVSDSAAAVMGPAGAGAVSTLVLAALASSVCAMVITGPRIYMEMARDGVLPRFFGHDSGRRVPVAAALAQSSWSAILVMSGTFEQIVTYTGFAIVVFSGLAVLSLFVLRRRLGVPRTFGVPWYPVLPALFVACVALIAVASFRYAPGPSLAGLALIGAGIPLSRMWRRADRQPSLPASPTVPVRPPPKAPVR